MDVPQVSKEAVLTKSVQIPDQESLPRVHGYDLDHGLDYHALLQSYKTTGFQATNFGLAVDQINAMVGAGMLHTLIGTFLLLFDTFLLLFLSYYYLIDTFLLLLLLSYYYLFLSYHPAEVQRRAVRTR